MSSTIDLLKRNGTAIYPYTVSDAVLDKNGRAIIGDTSLLPDPTKTIVENIISGGGDNSVELTKAEYDALTETQKKNGTVYYVTDESSSAIQTMTFAEFSALSPKPNSGIIGIINGFTINKLYDMSKYIDGNLIYSDTDSIVVDASMQNFTVGSSTWGGLSITNPANITKSTNYITVPTSSVVSYNLGNANASYTAYAVIKSKVPAQLSTLIGSKYADSTNCFPEFFVNTSGVIYTSTYGMDYDIATDYSVLDYHILAMSVDCVNKKLSFYADNGFIRSYTFGQSGANFTVLSGLASVEGYIKYVGVVNVAETDDIILSNIDNLKKYL